MTRRARRQKRTKSKAAQKCVLLIGGLLLAVALIAFLAVYFVRKNAVEQIPDHIIAGNIYIEDVDVSGMTAKEAKEAVLAKVSKYQDEEVVLVAEEAEMVTSLEELGFAAKNLDELVEKAVAYGKSGSVWSRYETLQALEEQAEKYDLVYLVDGKTTGKVISDQLPELENAAKEATIKRVDGQFVLTDEQIGKQVDLEASVEIIEEYFNNNWEHKGTERIDLVTKVEEPKITKAQLSQIQDALGTFSTTFVAGSSRGKNIANGAKRINGIVIMPGEEISVSDAMGERTVENGYLEAGAYLNGKTVQSVGGGICQVSTTLYNAAILAELEITERHSHSMLVDYVKPAMDAAVAEGAKDLKIKNNGETPVYIEGYTVGGKITFTIYGKETRAEGRVVSYVSEVISRKEPAKKFVASNNALGVIKRTVAPHASVKSKLWKVVTENGVEVSRTQFNSSNYMASPGTWSVGTATDNAEAKRLVTSAISSQNEAKINAAIAQAKEIINKSQQTTTTPSTPTTPTTPTTPSAPDQGTGNE